MDTVEKWQRQLEQSERDFAGLRQALLALEQIVHALREENVELMRKLAELTQRNAALEAEAAALKEKCARLDRERDAMYQSETFRYVTKPVWRVLDRLKTLSEGLGFRHQP